MDNLVESFTRQAANARQLRTKHEDEAIALIKQLGLTGSKIQVSGATLQYSKKKAPATLTWGYLESEVPKWAASTGVTPAQAASLMKWLHDHRDTRETEELKKQTNDK